MIDFSQITLVVGVHDRTEGTIRMLGTGFLISNDGKIVTARHVIGNETNDLVVLMPHIKNIDEYPILSKYHKGLRLDEQHEFSIEEMIAYCTRLESLKLTN